MIASVENRTSPTRIQTPAEAERTTPEWHCSFMRLLPRIRRNVEARFHYLRREARDEAVQESIVIALVAYVRLVNSGKEDAAFSSSLARYAVARVREGRRAASRLNINDVTSQYCRQRKGIAIESIHQNTPPHGDWRELVVEDRRCRPADVAATRIDFQSWLDTLSPRDRRIAEVLATGESTKQAAKRFRISPARISQLRNELRKAWRRFQGELAAAPA